MITFTNPRLEATFTDWPLGGSKRGQCKFYVEYKPSKGYRICRVTTGKPKTATYGGRCAIVDGSNGRTYILQETSFAVKVWSSDFMDARHDEIGHSSYVSPDNEARYCELFELIKHANRRVSAKVVDL